MLIVLWLLAVQGAIGAFDTVFYHEWRARLPALGANAAPELRLHAVRDALYSIIFGTLPWLEWCGGWAIALAAVLVAEIVFTMWDFVVEIAVRKPIGDVFAGERVTHAVMGIIYGTMIANLIPIVLRWWSRPTALSPASLAGPVLLNWLVTVMAVGVFLSGLRDLYASIGGPYSRWPWKPGDAGSQEASR